MSRKQATGSGAGPYGFGMTAKQRKWADLIYAGIDEREAYYKADYRGDEKTCATALSRMRVNSRIVAYLDSLKNPEPRPKTNTEWLDRYLQILEKDFDSGSSKDRQAAVKAHATLKGLWVDRAEDLTRRDRTPEQQVAEVRARLGDDVAAPLAKRLGVKLNGAGDGQHSST